MKFKNCRSIAKYVSLELKKVGIIKQIKAFFHNGVVSILFVPKNEIMHEEKIITPVLYTLSEVKVNETIERMVFAYNMFNRDLFDETDSKDMKGFTKVPDNIETVSLNEEMLKEHINNIIGKC